MKLILSLCQATALSHKLAGLKIRCSRAYLPLSLYALTIAESGARKSFCDKPLMAALREYEREIAAGRFIFLQL